MSTQLFATVSVEQQEIIAGGYGGRGRRGDYDNVIDNESSYYQKEKLSGETYAGRYGASTDFDALRITDSWAKQVLKFENY